MPSKETTVRIKADLSKLKSEMQAAERQIKLVNSEFKAATAGMDSWAKSAQGVAAKTKQLGSVLEQQNKKLALMEQELEKTKELYGENSAQADRVKIAINNQKAAIAKTEADIRKYNIQLNEMATEMQKAADGAEEFESATDKLKSSISEQESKLSGLKKHYADLVASGDELGDEAKQTAEAIDKLSSELVDNKSKLADAESAADKFDNSLEEMDDAAQKVSDGFTVFKAALADLVADGIRAGIQGLKDFAREAIEVGTAFESSMSNVQAISGASADQMQQLTDKAKEMGETTVFSASQSADAFGYMAMAGWKTEEMLSGIEGVMNLAAASGADLATTSDIVTDALTAMGYQAKDAGRLADVMAAASSNSNTNVEMMGATFKYVAPIIGALGMNMEDAAVAIGLMANAGIKGEKSGTALRSVLNRLSAPPKECATEMEKLGISLTDNDGKMKSLHEVMIELRQAFKNLSETEQTAAAKHIAGAEAMSGLLAVVNASDADFQKLTVAINDSTGAAASMAETMNDNVGGQLTLLRSKIEGIMIKLFEKASGSMKNGIKTVGDALDQVDWDKAGKAVGDFATKAANMFAYLITNSSTIISILKTLGTVFATLFVAQKISSTVTAFTSLITVIKGAQSASALLSSAMGALGISMSALPVLGIVAGLGALALAAQVGTQRMKENAEAAYGLNAADQNLINTIADTTQAIQSSNDAIRSEGEGIDLSYQKLEKMKESYNNLIDENGNVKKGYEDLAQTLLGNLAEGLGLTIDKLKENIDANGKLSASIDELIDKKKQEAKLAAFEDNYNEALKNEVKTWENLTEAKEKEKEAAKAVSEAEERHNKALAELDKITTNGFTAGQRIHEEEQAAADLDAAKQKYEELSQAVKDAQADWASSQSTIENYEKATSASMNNNADELNAALSRMQNGIVNYGTATKEQLEQQVVDTTNSLNRAREEYKAGVVDESFVNNVEYSLEQAKQQLDKFAENAGTAGTNASDNLKGSTADGLSNLVGTIDEIGKTSYKTLDRALGNWDELGQSKTDAIVEKIANGESDIAGAAEASAQAGADAIKGKTSEYEAAAEENIKSGYIGKIESMSGDVESTGANLPEWTSNGAKSNDTPIIDAGNWTTEEFAKGVIDNVGEAESAATEISDATAKQLDSGKDKSATSGQNFGLGFADNIDNGTVLGRIASAAANLVNWAISKLREANQEGSPSKLSAVSGKYFGEGFEVGINSTSKVVKQAAANLAKDAITSLKKAQKEGSPSKLTYESGKMFTQGFINGISSLEKSLVTTTKNLVNSALAELLKLSNFNFSEVTEAASSQFSSGVQKQISNMINQINYQNQQQLKDFDNTIKQLQETSANEVAAAQEASQKKQEKYQKKIEKKQSKEQTKSTKNQIKNLQKKVQKEKDALSKATDEINASYDKQIEEQQKMKEAYQQAASSMISEFTQACNEYQTAAQKLIDTTMNKITSDYQSQYDALISKQDNLISKLKAAGDLFNLSSANVMTINDITEQTAAIKQYASKLESIKNKVSSELFDQIASYDMKEGEAFMDRLLAMSDAELQAYSDAYDEKMRVSESLSKNIYKKDFDNIASNYEKAMKEAFAGLPKQLEELGWQTMKGFLSGLTSNTSYMEESVRTFISGMVDAFKQQLGIHSPSKVGISLGENFGGAFADGLLEMVNAVKDAAKDISETLTDTLDISDSLKATKNSIALASGQAGYNRNAGQFVGDRNQIINFNQINNSPKALDRLTIYRQTQNQLFSAKVGLSNV